MHAKCGTPIFGRQQEEGVLPEEEDVMAKEGQRGKSVTKKGMCNSVKFQRKVKKDVL